MKKMYLSGKYLVCLLAFIFLGTLSVAAQTASGKKVSFFKEGAGDVAPRTENVSQPTRSGTQFNYTGSWRGISEIGYDGYDSFEVVFQEGESMIWFNEDGTYVVSNYRNDYSFQRRWWYVDENTFGDSDGFIVTLLSFQDGTFKGSVTNVYEPGYLTTLTLKRDNQVCMVIGEGFGYLKDPRTKHIVGASADGETRLRVDVKSIAEKYAKYQIVLSSQYGSDETVCGTVSNFKKTGESTASFFYTVPKVYPSIEGRIYTVKMKLNLCDTYGNVVTSGVLPVRIIRPPVLLIHGLGDSDTCFYKFKEYLLNTPANYSGFQVHRADYRATNRSPFVVNTYVVQDCFMKLFQNCYELGYVASKADIIGHSMGGLLAREYIQDVSSDGVYKLITLNTPHFGSQGANLIIKDMEPYFFAKLADWIFEGQFGAIRDLQVNSEAFTSHLNTPSGMAKLKGIPIHTVCTEYSANGSIGEIVTQDLIPMALKAIVKLFGKGDDSPLSLGGLLDLIYGGPSDLVVSFSSQAGGLSGNHVSVLSNNTMEVIHMNTPKNPVIHELLKGLLAKSPESPLFTKQGLVLKPEKELATADVKKIYEYLPIHAPTKSGSMKSGSSRIRINECALDDSRRLNVGCDVSSDVEAHVVLVSMDGFSYLKDELSFQEAVDPDYGGTISVYALARTTSGELVTDAAKVNVKRIIDESLYEYASFEGGNEMDTLLLFKGEFSTPLMELYRADGKVELVFPDRYELPDWTDTPNNSAEIREGRVYGVSEGSGWLVGTVSSFEAVIPYKVIDLASIELADGMDTAIDMPAMNNVDKTHFVNFAFLSTKKAALLSFVKTDISSVLIEIYDINGKLHKSFRESFQNELFINLDSLSSGTYVIRISEKNSNESFKFIVP